MIGEEFTHYYLLLWLDTAIKQIDIAVGMVMLTFLLTFSIFSLFLTVKMNSYYYDLERYAK